MTGKNLITILGATGAQGGGLARAILSDPQSAFSVRAVTRDPNSEKAKALAALGAELFTGDIDDPAQLAKAFAGAYGVYAVTFYWAHLNPARESAEALAIATAAKTAGIKHLIWSTLEDTRKWIPLSDNRMPTLMEKYKVPHFDAKGEANKFFVEAGVPTTFLQTTFYWENLIYFGNEPKKTANGTYAFTLPMGNAKLSGIASEDIGKCAYGIFKLGDSQIAKTVSIAGDHLTGTEMAATLTEMLGVNVVYNAIEPAVFRSFGFPGADDIGNMFQFYRDFEEYFTKARNLDEVRKLNPELQTFRQWLSKNKSRIPLG